MKKIHNYISGKSFSISKKELPVEDPSKGEVIANVVCITKASNAPSLEEPHSSNSGR